MHGSTTVDVETTAIGALPGASAWDAHEPLSMRLERYGAQMQQAAAHREQQWAQVGGALARMRQNLSNTDQQGRHDQEGGSTGAGGAGSGDQRSEQ